jgi:hypothetical protein
MQLIVSPASAGNFIGAHRRATAIATRDIAADARFVIERAKQISNAGKTPRRPARTRRNSLLDQFLAARAARAASITAQRSAVAAMTEGPMRSMRVSM